MKKITKLKTEIIDGEEFRFYKIKRDKKEFKDSKDYLPIKIVSKYGVDYGPSKSWFLKQMR